MITEKTVYLIAGPNGSGKTTLAKELLNKYSDLKFMNADEVAATRGLGMVDAARIVLQDMNYSLNNGESFIWETTLSGTYQNKFLKQARDAQYKIIFSYVMLASAEQNIARVRQRVALGGHNVPDDILRRRYLKSIMNFAPVCEMSDSWILYYNGDKKIIEIARGDNTTNEMIINDNGYQKYQVAYNTALEEIVTLANRGARLAQYIARQHGIRPMFEKIQSVSEKVR